MLGGDQDSCIDFGDFGVCMRIGLQLVAAPNFIAQPSERAVEQLIDGRSLR